MTVSAYVLLLKIFRMVRYSTLLLEIFIVIKGLEGFENKGKKEKIKH